LITILELHRRADAAKAARDGTIERERTLWHPETSWLFIASCARQLQLRAGVNGVSGNGFAKGLAASVANPCASNSILVPPEIGMVWRSLAGSAFSSGLKRVAACRKRSFVIGRLRRSSGRFEASGARKLGDRLAATRSPSKLLASASVDSPLERYESHASTRLHLLCENSAIARFEAIVKVRGVGVGAFCNGQKTRLPSRAGIRQGC